MSEETELAGAAAPAAGQPARLTDHQISWLLSGIDPNRIGRDAKGFAHLEAWDVRRHLIRVFGIGGYTTDQQEMTLVKEIERPPDEDSHRTRWTVIYRCTVVLTVMVRGVELGHWHGTAAGDATNFPSLADAHDMAMKTADSQALKRAAVNLGDQFGLSLYNNGSRNPVVLSSLAYLKPTEAPTAPDDPPVQPEPDTEASGTRTAPSQEPSVPASDEAVRHPAVRVAADQRSARRAERETALREMREAAEQAHFTDQLPTQFEESFGHPIDQGTAGEFRQARDLIRQENSA